MKSAKAAVLAVLMFLASIGSVLAQELVAGPDDNGTVVTITQKACTIDGAAKVAESEGVPAPVKMLAAEVLFQGVKYTACYTKHDQPGPHVDVVVDTKSPVGLVMFPVPIEEFKPRGKQRMPKGTSKT